MKVEAQSHVWPETLEILNWYERSSPGLGIQFAFEVQSCLQLIGENPRLCPVIYTYRPAKRRVRRMIMKRFPYGIYFTASDEEVLVIAIVHLKRQAAEWKKHAR